MNWITFDNKTKILSEKKYRIDWNAPSLSIFQFEVKKYFKPYWWEDVVCEEVNLPGTRLRVDLINFTKMIAIEVNGKFHAEYTAYWQKTAQDFEKQVVRDVMKEHLLEKNGFRVIEVYEKNMPLTAKWVTQTFGEGILD